MRKLAWLMSGLMVMAVSGWVAHAEEKEDPNRPANYTGPKEGTFVGEVSKSDAAHRLIVTGKDGTRHFFPRWIGGMPNEGGGFDKAMMEKLSKLNPGDQVEVKWTMDERFRVLDVKVTKAAPKKAD